MANDDPMESVNKLKGHVEKMLVNADKALKKATAGISEIDKAFVKIDGNTVMMRMMSNGITTIEFADKKAQKKHFDSHKK